VRTKSNALIYLALSLLLGALSACAQSSSQTNLPSDHDSSSTLLGHSATDRYWVSGQINVIGQGHPAFRAPYSGPNSLRPQAEFDVSDVFTLYTGLELTPNSEVVLDVESAGGHGISDAHGLAGYTNLDVVRNPNLGAAPYVARLLVRRIIPLSHEKAESDRGPLEFWGELPVRRIEIVAGKFSLVDFSDNNAVGSDDHLQFMNWAVDNNGAYDYAANTRGYTDGVMLEYDDRAWAIRFAEALMPKVANGIHLDADIARARSENIEFELDHGLLPGRKGATRLLSFVNHANMSNYREAIEQYRAGLVSAPDVTLTRRQGRIKYGFGVNLEQNLTHNLRAYVRWGRNLGRNESFAYTEVDRTIAYGVDLRGSRWRRPDDRLGLTSVTNYISGDHREYLALGGLGFILADGKLNYGPERIIEGYDTFHLWRGLFASLDLQRVSNPGYNRDRGPVLVPAVRVHADL
jgi:high affinity Mn2+ porin